MVAWLKCPQQKLQRQHLSFSSSTYGTLLWVPCATPPTPTCAVPLQPAKVLLTSLNSSSWFQFGAMSGAYYWLAEKDIHFAAEGFSTPWYTRCTQVYSFLGHDPFDRLQTKKIKVNNWATAFTLTSKRCLLTISGNTSFSHGVSKGEWKHWSRNLKPSLKNLFLSTNLYENLEYFRGIYGYLARPVKMP